MVTKSGPVPVAAMRRLRSSQKAVVADRRLDADRQAGGLGERSTKSSIAVDVVEGGVPGRADAVDAHRDAADGGDLRGHLGAGQHAAEARLGALAELDLDGPHRCRLDGVDEPVEVEAAVLVAAAEVARADLADEVAAVAVVGRDAALAGVVQAAGERRAPG